MFTYAPTADEQAAIDAQAAQDGIASQSAFEELVAFALLSRVNDVVTARLTAFVAAYHQGDVAARSAVATFQGARAASPPVTVTPPAATPPASVSPPAAAPPASAGGV